MLFLKKKNLIATVVGIIEVVALKISSTDGHVKFLLS